MTEIYEHLARLIEYPTAGLDGETRRCAAVLEQTHPEAARFVREFHSAIQNRAAGELQEAYTALFDFQSDTSLYIGHHLFGEDWRRSMFMAQLNHRYRESGFSCGAEMPDHLAIVLRFLSHAPDLPERDELTVDCILPALKRALAASEARRSLYTPALRAVAAVFAQQFSAVGIA